MYPQHQYKHVNRHAYFVNQSASGRNAFLSETSKYAITLRNSFIYAKLAAGEIIAVFNCYHIYFHYKNMIES